MWRNVVATLFCVVPDLQLETDIYMAEMNTNNDSEKKQGVEMYSDIEFHHVFPLQLRFFDADQFGHINNSIYFQYYDTAKMDYFVKLGVPVDNRHVTVTAHIDADFLQQVYTSDTHIEVQSAVTHIGHKSFVFVQRVVDSETGEVKCIGRSVIVSFDLKANKSVEMWQEWVDAIEKFEGRNLRNRR